MFEQGLAYLLKKLLGEYVEDGNILQERIQVGVWSGLIVLENLVLKNSVFDLIDVPISLNYGYIGRLELRIPWGNLGVDPVTIIIDKINILIEPKYEWNPGAADKREQAVKQAKLAAAELFANKRLIDDSTWSYKNAAKKWFLSSFVNKIIDNIQITVREVHIRYEDHLSCPSSFCIGLSFESLHVQSRDSKFSFEDNYSPIRNYPTNNNYNPSNNYNSSSHNNPMSTPLQNHYSKQNNNDRNEMDTSGSDTYFKLVQLNHLAFYWNPLTTSGIDICTCSYIGRSNKEIQSFMSKTIATRIHQFLDRPRHHYILLPVDINAFLDMSFNSTTGVAKAQVKLFVSEISIEFEDRQFREIVSMAVNMSNFAKLERFSEYRPKESVFKDAAAWWRYAINAVIIQIRIDRKKRFDWTHLISRARDKLVYIELWKSKLISPTSVMNSLQSSVNVDLMVCKSFDRHCSSIYQTILKRAKEAHDLKKQNKHPTRKTSGESKFTASLNSVQISKYDDATKEGVKDIKQNKPSQVQQLNKETMELLTVLEYQLNFEDIILFRSFAEKELSHEETQQSWLGGLFTWVTGGKSAAVADEEKRKLFEALKYDPERVFRGGKTEADKNEVIAIIFVHLQQGSITLGLTSPDISYLQSSIPFLKFQLNDLKIKSTVMGDGSHIKANLSLQDFEAFELESSQSNLSGFDSCNNQSMKNKFIFRRELGIVENNESPASQISTPSQMSDRHNVSPPLFSTMVEIFPPSLRDTEIVLNVNLEELEIIISPYAKWTDSLNTFITWPEDLKYWSEMEMTAMNQLADIKSRIDAKLEYMMNNHSNMIVEAKLKAPVIIVIDSDYKKKNTSDVLVMDLGTLYLHTEKLAKAQRQKTLDMRSHTGFTSDATITPIPTVFPFKKSSDDSSSHNKNIDPDTPYINGDLSSLKKDLLVTTPPAETLSRNIDEESDINETTKPKAFSRFRKPSSNYTSTINTGNDIENDDSDLFDIFQLQITEIELYLISYDMLHISSSAELDKNKVVIVDKFEISVEIQSSVLPWDSTLPPIKLSIDIPEINVQLSEVKLKRLHQFATHLSTSSNVIINNNLEKLNKFNDLLKRKSLDLKRSDDLKNKRDSSNGLHFYDSVGDNSKINNELKSKEIFSRRSPSIDLSVSVLSQMKKKVSANNSNTSFRSFDDYDDEDDDKSFFSLDENDQFESLDHVNIQIENLRIMILQKENNRNNIMSKIRISESDPSKVNLTQSLKSELLNCESELHKLKVDYVESLVQGSNIKAPGFEKDISKMDNEDVVGFRDFFDSLIMEEHTRADLGHRRDLISASIFKIRPSLAKCNDEDIKLKSIGNKEFIFAKLNISIVNIDLLCSNTLKTNDNSASTRRNQSKKKSKFNNDEKNQVNTLFRLKLAGMNIRLRHRNYDSKLNFSLREIDLEDFSYNSKLGLPGPHYSSEQMYLISSEYSSFDAYTITSMTRKYMPSGSNDFLKIKYEVIYGDLSEEVCNENSHNIRVNVGFIGFNIEQVRLSNLFITINNVLSNPLARIDMESKKTFTQDKNIGDLSDKSIDFEKPLGKNTESIEVVENNKPFQNVNLMFKIDCFLVSLLHKNQPYCCMTVWSLTNSLQLTTKYFSVSLKLLDFTVHKICKGSIDSFATLNDSKDMYDKSVMLSKRSDVTSAGVSFLMKADISNDVPLVTTSLKTAPFTTSINLEFIGDVMKFVIEGPLMKVFMPEASKVDTEIEKSQQINILKCPIDYFINPILDSCSGSMVISLGGCDFVLPSSNSQGIKFSVQSVDLKTQWGDRSNLSGIEILFEIFGIDLKICDHSVIENFDFRGILISMPSIILPRGLNEMPFPLLSFDSIYAPLRIDDISRNEVQMSFSVSPIVLHLNEVIISNFYQWISVHQKHLENIQSIINHSGGSNITDNNIKIFQLSKYLAKFDCRNEGKCCTFGFSLKSSFRIYEITFDFETFVKQSPIGFNKSENINRTPRKIDEKNKLLLSVLKSHKKNNNVSNNKLEKKLLFKATAKNIFFQSNIVANSVEFENFPNLAPAFCRIDLNVQSFDLEYFGDSSFKRLLCTILITDDDVKKNWIPSNTEHLELLTISAEISDLFDIDFDINFSNFNITLIPDAIISLLNLVSSYISNATYSENANLMSSELNYQRVSLERNYLNESNKRDQKDSATIREDSYAHPSSVPMSFGKEVNKSAIEVISTQKKLPTTILTEKSFSLPSLIKSINIVFTARSNAIWIPSDKNSCIGSSLCASMDLDFNLFDNPQNIESYLNSDLDISRSNSNAYENNDFTLWSYSCNLSSVKVFLSKSIPSNILRKIDIFEERNDIKVELPYQNLDKKFKTAQDFYFSDDSKASQKTIVLPFDVNISGLINAVKGSSSTKIIDLTELKVQSKCFKLTNSNLINVEHVVDINLIDVEVQVFLDYRPFIRIYDYAINPILDYINSLTLSENNSSQVKSKNLKAGNNLDNEDECQSAECECFCVDSSIDLLLCLQLIATSKFNLSLNNFTVFMINDIYYQPLSIARLVGNSLNIKAILLPSIEKYVSIKIDIDPLLNSEETGVTGDFLESMINIPNQIISGSEKYLKTKHVNGNIYPNNSNTNENQRSKSIILFQCSIECSLRIDYYNQKLIATEPFCEPFIFSLNFSMPKNMSDQSNPLIFLDGRNIFSPSFYSTEHLDNLFQNYLNICRDEKSHIPNNIYSLSPPLLNINIKPKIDINITLSLLEIVFLTYKSLSSIDIKETSRSQESAKDVSMMTIRNDSGLILKYWTKDINRSEEVLSNSQQPLNLDSHFGSKFNKSSFDGSFDRYYTGISKSINMLLYQPDGVSWLPLQDISLEGVGCRLLMMEQQSKKARKYDNRSSSNTNNSNSTTCIALELVSVGGIKTLIVRSTMRVFNSTHVSFKVLLVQTVRNNKRDILWESILPPNSSAHVPANFCSIIGSKFLIEPISVNTVKSTLKVQYSYNESAEIPVPEIHGLNQVKTTNKSEFNSEVSVHESRDEELQIDLDEGNSKTPNNDIYWRKKLHQMRGAVDTLTYSHWLNFSKKIDKETSNLKTKLTSHFESLYCNLNVISKGIPRSNNARVPESCMLRTLILTPAITVVNLLACDLDVIFIPDFLIDEFEDFNDAYKINKLLFENIQQVSLASGESKDCMNYHSTKSAFIAVRLQNDLTSDKNSWSEIITISGCKVNSSVNTTLSFDVLYKNQSTLTIYLDIVDNCGSRIINIYVPYWIITTSFLNLQFQHETTTLVDHSRNGIDGLAPDQLYEENKSFDNIKSRKLPFAKRSLPRGMGKVRGCAGIVLGPENSLRGFADVLTTQNSGLYSSSNSYRVEEMSQLSIHRNSRSPSVTDGNLIENTNSFSYDHSSLEKPYRLVHCSYTNKEKKIGKIRMRSKGSYWGNHLNLDAIGNSDLYLYSIKGFIDHDGDFNRNLSHMSSKEGSHMFPVGVTVSVAEPPFNRTKIVIVTDRLVLINSIGQSIEVKQFSHDTIFSLRPNAESPMWWRPGQKNIQVRLAKFGWSWSGKFSLSQEGEIPIRLRNDFDNTVFFVLVQIVKQGPKVCIIFRGGDKFSPYRFENHTLDTFKIKQKGQSLYTNLLPYHCCAYAWDDPLAPHIFTMEVLTNSLQSQDEWCVVGTYSFDRLQNLESATKENLVMRVVAQGPTRVLQIFDRRVITNGQFDFERNSRIESNGMKNNKVKIGPFSNSAQPNSLSNVAKPVNFQININIGAIGISVVDQTPQELIYVSLSGISAEYLMCIGQETISMDLERLQIDNQLWSTPYPSLFYPLVHLKETENIGRDNRKKFFSLLVKRDFEYAGIDFFPVIKIVISPFDVNLEGTLITRLIKMVSYATETIFSPSLYGSHSKLSDLSIDLPLSMSYYYSSDIINSPFPKMTKIKTVEDLNSVLKALSIPNEYSSIDNKLTPIRTSNLSDSSKLNTRKINLSHLLVNKALVVIEKPTDASKQSSKLYIQSIEISEIKLNLSFNPVITGDSMIGDDSLVKSVVNVILLAIGSTFAKIDNCPIRFKNYQISHLFTSGKGFLELCASNYTMQILRQAYLLVGSSEILGNPVRLLHTMGEGLWDFMYMPTRGLFISPEEFAMGILRGTSSLFRRTIASLCSTAGHLASSLQVGLITLGVIDAYPHIDHQYQISSTSRNSSNFSVLAEEPHITSSNKHFIRPSTVLEGLKLGVKGLFTDPITGFRVDGIKGFCIGSLKGFIGFAARPIFGFLGTSANTLDHISFGLLPRFLGNEKLKLLRARPPRFFHNPNLPLNIYSANENIGQELLSRISGGEYRHEGYVWHSKMPNKTVLLLTKIRIMIVCDNFDVIDILWQCPVNNILSLEMDYTLLSTVNEWYQDDSVDESDYIIDNSKTIADISDNDIISGHFSKNNRLQGNPILHIYHLPYNNHANKRNSTNDKSMGLILADHKISTLPHDQLLEFLEKLFKLNSKINPSDIQKYLTDTNVDLNRFTNNSSNNNTKMNGDSNFIPSNNNNNNNNKGFNTRVKSFSSISSIDNNNNSKGISNIIKSISSTSSPTKIIQQVSSRDTFS